MTNNDLLEDNLLTKEKKFSWVLPGIIAFIIAMIPFCAGKYYEFNTKDAFDSALNVYHGHEVAIGKKIGTDFDPSAKSGTLLINTIGVMLFGYSEFGPKLIQAILQLTALGAAFACIRKLYGSTAAVISVVLGSFYLSLQPFAKFGNVKEQYMIAFMIFAAVSFVNYEFKKNDWWLLLCGGFAINTWYFKPTGFSVLAAIIIYTFITMLMRQRKLREFGIIILRLVQGACIGMVPILLLYLFAGSITSQLKAFPASAAFGLLGAYYLVKLAIWLIKTGVPNTVKDWKEGKKNKVLVIIGGTAAVLIAGCLYFKSTASGKQFFEEFTFASAIGKLNFFDDIYQLLFSQSGYLGGSKASGVIETQITEVAKFSHSFVIITGLALGAIILKVIEIFTPGKKNAENEEIKGSTKKIDPVFLMFAIWWVLDMLFVWISPRAYVQYFLPPNASGMFLAGYMVYRTIQSPLALAIAGACWLIAELVTAGNSAVDYSKLVIIISIISALTGTALLFTKMTARPKAIICVTLLVAAMLIANSKNYSAMSEKIEYTKQSNKAGGALWEHVGKFIKENSTDKDEIYVWGWFPGIYIESNRSCPSYRASYSNMHSDSPNKVELYINNLISYLVKNPPLYIVDSQKMHYPFYNHPVFDLWPTLPLGLGNEDNRKILTDKNQIASYLQNYEAYVEKVCVSLMTNPKHPGGPLSQEKAQELAKVEAQRHKSMKPLRDFVMQNYVPYKRFANMVLYKRK